MRRRTSTQRTSTQRTGRRWRPSLALLFLTAGAGAVFAITVVLDSLTGNSLAEPACYVEDGEHHVRLSPEQMANAALIAGVGMDKGVSRRAITIALATAMQESSLRNLDYGDRDSLGLFQQRPSQGWGSPQQVQDRVYASTIFYDRLLEVPGYENLPLTQAAQKVQISAFPHAYAKHEELAGALQRAFTGAAPRTLTCELPGSPVLNRPLLAAELQQAIQVRRPYRAARA